MDKAISTIERILRFRYTIKKNYLKGSLEGLEVILKAVKSPPPGVIKSLEAVTYILGQYDDLANFDKGAIMVRLEEMAEDLKEAANPPALGVSVEDKVRTKDIFGRS